MTKPGVRKLAQVFAEHRFGDEEPRDMHEVSPAYAKGAERGRKDNFDKAFDESPSSAYYVGKSYKSGDSELISMGLELLYKDPAKLISRDPEYARFLFKVLGG
jgi:hypothetical protein